MVRLRAVHRLWVLTVLLFACSYNAQGQHQKDAAANPVPVTKLEAFLAKTGSVTIRGSSEIGSVGGDVLVDAVEFRDAANSRLRVTGLSIDVKESGRLERDSTSFVDYDEIDSLLQGIDYISRVDASVTLMKNFDATYTTKGDFSVTASSENHGGAFVSSGTIGRVVAVLKLSDLPRLSSLIQNGKDIIDSATKNAKP